MPSRHAVLGEWFGEPEDDDDEQGGERESQCKRGEGETDDAGNYEGHGAFTILRSSAVERIEYEGWQSEEEDKQLQGKSKEAKVGLVEEETEADVVPAESTMNRGP